MKHYVKPCWDSTYKGEACLEMADAYGFFKDDNDHRPSSCRWVKKSSLRLPQRRLTCPDCWNKVRRAGRIHPRGSKPQMVYYCKVCGWRGLWATWRRVYHCKCGAEFLKPETRYVGTVQGVLRGNRKLRRRDYCPVCKRWLR